MTQWAVYAHTRHMVDSKVLRRVHITLERGVYDKGKKASQSRRMTLSAWIQWLIEMEMERNSK